MNPVDVIGDIHGCADKLKGLLQILGYQEADGAFWHPDRTAIFVGDLIDRGTQQVEVLSIARSMVEAGSAQVLMGNHEFNAVSYVTPDPSDPDTFMRPRSGPKGAKNRTQHAAFLRQIGENSVLHREIISWFKTLPLYLDLGAIRVIHACWHDPSVKAVNDLWEAGRPLEDGFFVDANRTDHELYDLVETILKGPEVVLGGNGAYLDKEGNARTQARIRWWDTSAASLRDLAQIPAGSVTPNGDPFPALPDEPVEQATRFRYASDIPVFFGHYWFRGTPRVTGPSTSCLDYSAVAGGPLVAYRWDGEDTLRDDHLVSFGAA